MSKITHRRIEKAKAKYLNTIWATNEGYEIEITEYFSNSNVTIKFCINEEIIKYNTTIQNIKNGNIKYPYHSSVYGVGFVGVGKYTPSINRKDTKVYKHWSSMLQRSYSFKLQKKHPTYKNVTVCEEWHNFQVFAEWFEKSYNSETMEEWQLDKDIISPECRIYSPETCAFVPQEINLLFIQSKSKRGACPIGVSKHGNKFQVSLSTNGVSNFLGSYSTIKEAFYAYKIAKEKQVKIIAEKWKNLVDNRVYQTLVNYKTEIYD